MKKLTDEQIFLCIEKYRDEMKADIEKNLCLDCYNMVKRLKLTVNDVELKESACALCGKKPIVKIEKTYH